MKEFKHVKINPFNIVKHFRFKSALFGIFVIVGIVGGWIAVNKVRRVSEEKIQLLATLVKHEATIASMSGEIEALKNEDLRKTNEDLKQKIAEVEKTYSLAQDTVESLADARAQSVGVADLEKEMASAFNLLGSLKYDEAATKFDTIRQKAQELVVAKQVQIAAQAVPAQDLPASGSYRRQSVTTSRGSFTVSLIAEESSSVKMITDAASDDTCTDNCTALPLATYVSRNGGFAGINGSYFCPPDYPSCAGKVNSFDTLFFNARTKKYLNSDNNVYSTVPMTVQNADRSMRFMGQSLEWGRDTGINGGIANQPMLVSGGQALISATAGKGPRGFIGVKGGTLYIGVVHSADLGDAAAVLAILGLDTAMNLDGGGSSALYYNGRYVVGPGRNLPNAIILAR